MSIKITTLVENSVYGKGLQGEHGLSLLVDTGEHRLLFDTGVSDLFIRNAGALGIDLGDVDFLVLSHGHRDHTGGLHHFLAMNHKAKVICKKELFFPKFKEERENGVMRPDALDRTRFRFVEEVTGLCPGVFVFPQWPIADEEDTHFEHFFTLVEGRKQADTFTDELALVLKQGDEVSVLSACSHRGITNIVRRVQEYFPQASLKLVLGGFHIRNAAKEKFEVIARFFEERLPQRLGVCHCTGTDKYALFHQCFGDRTFYNYTGRIEIL